MIRWRNLEIETRAIALLAALAAAWVAWGPAAVMVVATVGYLGASTSRRPPELTDRSG